MSHIIYTLSDPITMAVRYVGMTSMNLKTRLNGHLYGKSSPKKTQWILSLKKQGLKPLIECVEQITFIDYMDKRRNSAEGYWISQFNTWGFDLFNDKSGKQKYRNI